MGAMNEDYRPRWLAEKLREAVEFSPVVVLSGARQTGKSTLLQSEAPFKDWPYLTLDDLDTRELAEKDPGRLAALHDRVVIDGVQKAPRLLAAVKVQVDRDRKRRFVLSGSANLLLMKKVTESLAGRCLYFDLMPFCLGEEGLKTPGAWLDHSFFENRVKMRGVESIADFRLFRGSLPPVSFLKKHSHVADWWRGYTRTYLERDLRDVSQVTSLSDFRRVMALLAASSGQILNQTNIARAAAISQATVGRYIGLLEITGLFVRLFPYSKNVRQRMAKSPKIYCLDTGLACSLGGIGPSDELPGEFRGQLIETLAFQNILVRSTLDGGRLFYLRKLGGLEREVDFVVERGGGFVTIEVKASTRAGFKDAANMLALKDLLPKWSHGVVLYNGTEIVKLSDRVYGLPIGMM
jgi:predicted AAA+ superfamily ATPase